MTQPKRWSIDVLIEEDDEHTEAKVILFTDDAECMGQGTARRNPADPNVPRVGEELAVARALGDLSQRLVEEAARIIEAWEGHRVELEA